MILLSMPMLVLRLMAMILLPLRQMVMPSGVPKQMLMILVMIGCR